MTVTEIEEKMAQTLYYGNAKERAITEEEKARFAGLEAQGHEKAVNMIVEMSKTPEAQAKMTPEEKENFDLTVSSMFDRVTTNVLMKEAEQKLAEVTATHEQVVDDVMNLAGDMVIASAEATGNALPTDADLYSEADQSIEGSRSR
nr:hypothetical protein [Bacilli bacterium]